MGAVGNAEIAGDAEAETTSGTMLCKLVGLVVVAVPVESELVDRAQDGSLDDARALFVAAEVGSSERVLAVGTRTVASALPATTAMDVVAETT